MQISIRVPYDEQRLKRMLKFVLRRSVKRIRVLGVVMAVIGVGLMAVTSVSIPMVAVVVGGLLYVFGAEPFLVWQSLRSQNESIRQDYELVVDEVGVEAKSASAATRLAWSTIQRVEEEPDAWFLVISKVQALAVYKDLMTGEQRAQFAGILAQRQPA